MKKEKIKFATLQDLVEWLELSKHDNIEVRDYGDCDWMSADEALVEYRDILNDSSDEDVQLFDDTELEVKEFCNPPEDDTYETFEDAQEAKKYGGDTDLIVRKKAEDGKPCFEIYTERELVDIFPSYVEQGIFHEVDDGIDYDELEAIVRKFEVEK